MQLQVEQLLATYHGAGVSVELKQHLKASIDENRHLLERLAHY